MRSFDSATLAWNHVFTQPVVSPSPIRLTRLNRVSFSDAVVTSSSQPNTQTQTQSSVPPELPSNLSDYAVVATTADRVLRAIDNGLIAAELMNTQSVLDLVPQALNAHNSLQSYFLETGVVVVSQAEIDDPAEDWALSLHTRGVGRASTNGFRTMTTTDIVRATSPAVDAQLPYRASYANDGYLVHLDNRADGLEHTIEVLVPPAGDGLVRVPIDISGLRASQYSGTEALLSHPTTGEPILRYYGLASWDATGKTLESRMEVSTDGAALALLVDDSGAVYPLTIDPTAASFALLGATGA